MQEGKPYVSTPLSGVRAVPGCVQGLLPNVLDRSYGVKVAAFAGPAYKELKSSL